MIESLSKPCLPCEGGVEPLAQEQLERLLPQVTGWQLTAAGTELERHYQFNNFYQVMAFVNAVAWIAHQEDHHPDMTIGYNKCTLRYSTHAIGGLTENDFICAAKVNQLAV